MDWNPENIIGMAPDPVTASRGEQLSSPYKWKGLTGNADFIWGECRGGGLTFFRVVVGLKDNAFKCACPSKKKPCKHIIGILLILARDSEAFRIQAENPEWIQQWIVRRKKAAEPVDPEELERRKAKRVIAQKKQRDQRLERMGEGFRDLESWLLDMIKQGLAASQLQGESFWQAFSSRMTDMQLRGISRRVRAIPEAKGSDLEWPARMLAGLADLYLAARGFEQLEALPIPLQQELLSIAGINQRKDDLLVQAGTVDEWAVIGQTIEVEENLRMRRVWLYGRRSRKKALLLDFVHHSMEFEDHWVVGKIVQAELVYFPAAYPLRALVKRRKETSESVTRLKGYANLKAMRTTHAEAMSQNPWLIDFPCIIDNIIITVKDNEIVLIDSEKHYISLPINSPKANILLALSCGHPITIFGEWKGDILNPLSVVSENRFVSL